MNRRVLFCVAVLLPAAGLVIAAPLVVRTAWFASGTHDHWVQTLDYPFAARGVNAQVVVFGDSAALYGVDPRIFARDTGETMANLSGSINSLGVMGDRPLAAYMRHNAAPRLLVIYLAPWDTGMPPQYPWPEGVIMMLRHATLGETLRYSLHHPVGMLDADMAILEMVLQRLAHPLARHDNHLDETGGFLAYPGTVQLEKPDCSLAAHAVPQDAGAWPRELASRWQTPATRVVLYLAPIPDCHDAGRFLRVQAETAAIGGPALLPPQFFIRDSFQVHITPDNVKTTTRLLEQALAKQEKEN